MIRARRGKTAPEKPVIIPAGPHGGKRFVRAVQMPSNPRHSRKDYVAEENVAWGELRRN
ncbi:MAG: hypothetical protein L3J98_02620 [Gammaproteobacteria bacterium]|nr:hypothetical protein [Gammaproteobacteria bacterium]MCF6259048.1 hypothetical protein [Gammaproteobacteria bacterium]